MATEPVSAKVRAFFALPLPGELAEAVGIGMRSLKKLAPELRWLGESKLHLTLKFLGGVAERDIVALAQGLERIASAASPIPARVLGLDAFPLPRRARVLVLELDDPSGALAALADSLETLAESFGVARETRAFKAHVTLARASPTEDLRALVEAFTFPRRPATFDRARLYQSTLSRSGSTYSVLHERLLGGQGAG